MTDIPDDVMKAANSAAFEAYDKENETWFDVRDVIARAILAERGRCAAVAERLRNEWAADSELWVKHGMHDIAKKSEEMSKGAALVADYINNI